MDNKKTKLTLSGIAKKSIKNIELARELEEIPHHPSIFLHQLKELPIKFIKQ